MADIVLINPRFEPSYWGLEHAMPFFGRRANLPVAALPLLAALTPPGHRVRLIDENVEEIDFELCARADIVGVTGMVVQRQRMRAVLSELKRRGVFCVVGGPWVSVADDYFGGLADVVFIGEAEETWPLFLREWERGTHVRRYEQSGPTDMTRVPVPRLDLLKTDRYLFGSVQISRGCPFTCEFCDIIVIFGRRPRLKTSEQVIAELEAVRAAGLRTAFIVDDNLIGNKKAIIRILRDIVEWQRANGYPLTFFAEASIDVADEPELLRLMVEADILAIFVGVETPNEAALRETKKLQNLRKGKTLVQKVRAIQDAGIEVWSGAIVGFDNDDGSIFQRQLQFLEEARIVSSMVSMFYERLLSEGRVDPSDEPAHGTNVIPLRMTPSELRDGFVRLLTESNAAPHYFDRLDDLFLRGRLKPRGGREAYWSKHPWRRRGMEARYLIEATAVFFRLLAVAKRDVRREYLRRMVGAVRQRPEPAILWVYALKCAMHYHVDRLIEPMKSGRIVNSY
jgi:hypothetical protein